MSVYNNNISYKILKSLGSPLIGDSSRFESVGSKELYKHAFKNRVGLFYLHILEKQEKLENLRSEYNQMLDRELQTKITLVRACKLLNELNIPYFVTMTIRPFPYTSNDVEFIHLGTRKQYELVVKHFQQNDYILLSTGPDASLLADPRGRGVVKWDKSGGRYYVDYSISMSVDYFQFLDKHKLAKHIKRISIDRVTIPVLDDKMELAVAIMHSVMEQRMGMEIYYYACWVLSELGIEELEKLKLIGKENHMILAFRAIFSIITQIHIDLYGVVPAKLQYVHKLFGFRRAEVKNFIALNRELHHRVSLTTFFWTLVFKQFEWNALKSTFLQLGHMIKPSFFKDLVLQLKRRRSEEDVYKLM